MRNLILLITASVFFSASCHKQDPNPAQYYIRCKVDGVDYLPNNCANCMRGQILGDTVFLLNANAGYVSMSIGIIKLDKIPIETRVYTLNNNLQQNGVYDNSPLVTDIFKTDSLRTGQLNITALDKTNKIVAGTFYYLAYNTTKNKIVNISNGEFRLKYTDY